MRPVTPQGNKPVPSISTGSTDAARKAAAGASLHFAGSKLNTVGKATATALAYGGLARLLRAFKLPEDSAARQTLVGLLENRLALTGERVDALYRFIRQHPGSGHLASTLGSQALQAGLSLNEPQLVWLAGFLSKKPAVNPATETASSGRDDEPASSAVPADMESNLAIRVVADTAKRQQDGFAYRSSTDKDGQEQDDPEGDQAHRVDAKLPEESSFDWPLKLRSDDTRDWLYFPFDFSLKMIDFRGIIRILYNRRPGITERAWLSVARDGYEMHFSLPCSVSTAGEPAGNKPTVTLVDTGTFPGEWLPVLASALDSHGLAMRGPAPSKNELDRLSAGVDLHV